MKENEFINYDDKNEEDLFIFIEKPIYFKALINKYLRICDTNKYFDIEKEFYDFRYSLYQITSEKAIEQIKTHSCRSVLANDAGLYRFIYEPLEDENDPRFIPNPNLDEINILVIHSISHNNINIIKDNINRINCVFYENSDLSEQDRKRIETRIKLISRKEIENN